MDRHIIIGSRAFFEGMSEFTSKDTNTLVWSSDPKRFTNYRQSSISSKCTVEYRAMTKDEIIKFAMRDKANGLEFGKFIVTEFAELIGLTIDDLKRLRAYYAEKIDDKQRYQLAICDAYIANNAFTLTDEQREKSYAIYSQARKEDVEEVEE